MHLPCFSGPMKTHLLDRHLIQTGEQMSCCSVICAFVLYSETQGTGHTHKHSSLNKTDNMSALMQLTFML